MPGYPSQMLYIPLVGGLDTKSDEKTVLPQDLVRLENGDYTEGGSLRFRAGYEVIEGLDQDGNVIEHVVGLGAFGDGWVMFSRRNAYAYDPNHACWSDMGAYCNATHVLSDVAPTTVAQMAPSLATVNGVTAVAWEDSRGGVRCTVFSDETGAIYVSEYVLASANASKPFVVAAGSSLLVCWFDEASDRILAKVVLHSDPRGSVQAATVVLADDAHTNGVFDLVSGDGVAHLAFRQDPGVSDIPVLKTINSAGAVVRTQTVSLVAPDRVRLAYNDTTGKLWLAYSSGINLSIRSYTATTLALVDLAGETLTSAANFAIGVNETGGISVWADEPDGVHTGNDLVHVWQRDSDGTAVADHLIRHSKVATNGWFDGAGSYCVLWHEATGARNLQSTYFLYRDDGVVCGRMLYGTATDMLSGTATTDGVLTRVSRVDDTDIWQSALAFRRTVDVSIDVVTVGSTLRPVFEHQQTKRCQFNMGAPVSAAELDGVLYASGSFLWAIDGFGPPVESSPLLFPEMQGSASDGFSGFDASGGGSMEAGTHNYRLYYEFMYGRGKRVRSAAIEVQYTSGAATEVDITYPTLTHTRYHERAPVAVVAYRTEANKATFYHRITDADPTVSGDNGYEANSITANTGVITDELAGGVNFVTREIDYRSRGEIVHFAPDGPAQLCVAQNRLFCTGGGERPNTVQYSFSTLDGAAVEFTDTTFLSELPEHGGDVVAMSRVDDVPVVFFQRGVAILDGVGITNTGLGAQYVPEMVSSDVGCSNARAIVPWDKGVMFQSQKGIYGIGQDGAVSYVGPGVEGFNNQTYTGAAIIPDTNIILFLCEGSTERTAMFDYFYGKWGTYAQHFGVACAATRSKFAYLRADGSFYVRDTESNQDGSAYIVFRMKTGPTREGLSAFLLRSFQLLGDYRSSHKIEVCVYYDNAPYPLQCSEWLPDTVLNTNFWGDFDSWGDFDYWFGDTPYSDYHFERRFKRSRARAVQFEIIVTPLASPGAAFEATEIALEVAPLPGPKRLARTRKI